MARPVQNAAVCRVLTTIKIVGSMFWFGASWQLAQDRVTDSLRSRRREVSCGYHGRNEEQDARGKTREGRRSCPSRVSLARPVLSCTVTR